MRTGCHRNHQRLGVLVVEVSGGGVQRHLYRPAQIGVQLPQPLVDVATLGVADVDTELGQPGPKTGKRMSDVGRGHMGAAAAHDLARSGVGTDHGDTCQR